MRFKTVCHNGSSDKLYYYKKDKKFVCYTCCGAMDVFTFISKMENCSYKQAINIVAKDLGLSTQVNRTGFKQKKLEIEEVNIFNSDVKAKTFDNTPINYFEPNTFYKGWIDEGISIDSMIKFGIRWDEVNKRIIIPVLNLDGELIGVRARRLFVENNKYMPLYFSGIDYAFPTGMALYGLYENAEIIRKMKTAYIFEGEKSVLKCDSYFGSYPAVATYGHNLSNQQLYLLAELGVEKIILCYDYDAGNEREIYKRTCLRARDMGFSSYYLYNKYNEELDVHDSPVDQGKDIYIKLLKNKSQ